MSVYCRLKKMSIEKHAFSSHVKDILSKRNINVSQQDATTLAYRRLRHFISKAGPLGSPSHSLDHTCLDLAYAGAYLGNLMYHHNNTNDMEGSEQAYDMGIALIERLAEISSMDSSLSSEIDDFVCNIACNYK